MKKKNKAVTRKITLVEAKEKVIEYANQNFPDFYNHEELNAAVTHWIHNPERCPPIMPKKLFKELPALFIEGE